jgi:hypothetical protein
VCQSAVWLCGFVSASTLCAIQSRRYAIGYKRQEPAAETGDAVARDCSTSHKHHSTP